MTRQRLLGALALVLLVAGIVGVQMLVEDEGFERPPTTARPAVAPEGSLRVGVPELPGTYNPFDIRARTPAGTQILSMVLPQLFDVAPDGTVRGRLVEEGSVEEGRGAVRFRLVEGARWSDGAPITVDDLRFTLQVIRSEEWPGPDAGYDLVDSFEADGRTITVRFRDALPGWQRLFSGDDFVLPRHRLEGEDLSTVWAAGPDLAGGPYELVGSTLGLDAVLTANDEWWGSGPGIEDLRVLTVPDATTLEQLFERGELDVLWMPAFTDRVRQANEAEFDVAVAPPGGRLLSVYVNTDEVPEDVRAAVLDLIDRDRFVDVLFADEAELATSWGLLESGSGWPRWFIDASKAQDIDATTVNFVTPEEQPMGNLLIRSVQRRARSTRLSFDAVRLGTEVLDGEWLPDGDFDVALVDEVVWPDPCWRCRFDDEYEGETNWARVDEFSDLAAAADAGELGAASELERSLEEQAVLLPMWRPAAVVRSRGVEGIEANAWVFGPFSRVERWTPAPLE